MILWVTCFFCRELFLCRGFEEKIEQLKEWMKIAGRSPWEKANDDVTCFERLWVEGKGGLPGVIKKEPISRGNQTVPYAISHIGKLSTETNQSNETYVLFRTWIIRILLVAIVIQCYSCLASSWYEAFKNGQSSQWRHVSNVCVFALRASQHCVSWKASKLMEGNSQKHTVNTQTLAPFEIVCKSLWTDAGFLWISMDFFQWCWHQLGDKVFHGIPGRYATRAFGEPLLWSHKQHNAMASVEFGYESKSGQHENIPNEYLGERWRRFICFDSIPMSVPNLSDCMFSLDTF